MKYLARYVSVCINLYEWVWTGISGLVQYMYNTCLDNTYIWSTVQVMYQYVWLPTIQWDILNGDVQHTKDLNI